MTRGARTTKWQDWVRKGSRMFVGGAIALTLGGCGESSHPSASAGGSAETAKSPAAPTAGASTGPEAGASLSGTQVRGAKLVGRWLRPDGGYVLEVKAVDGATGRMEVAYLNPRPIHVAQAEAKEADGKLTVFVELQDVGYPGSTYRLTYLPQQDQLFGTYYQPAADQSFDVEFVRMP